MGFASVAFKLWKLSVRKAIIPTIITSGKLEEMEYQFADIQFFDFLVLRHHCYF